MFVEETCVHGEKEGGDEGWVKEGDVLEVALCVVKLFPFGSAE